LVLVLNFYQLSIYDATQLYLKISEEMLRG
jgi:hypothetical protein